MEVEKAFAFPGSLLREERGAEPKRWPMERPGEWDGLSVNRELKDSSVG